MSQFMLMMRGNYDAWERLPPEDKQKLMEKYYAFVGELKKANRWVEGSALGKKRALLSGKPGAVEVVAGPMPEAREALNGYFLFTAETLDEAIEISRGCPCFLHGETAEVLELRSDH
jgi:hypothetical protein